MPFFYSYQEASRAAQQLGIRTVREYNNLRLNDKRLPSNPNIVYADVWSGWGSFLGKPQRYGTLQEASEAAQNLGAKTISEYQNLCGTDPKLVKWPNWAYKNEWSSWPEFLGNPAKYSTLQEASEFAQNHVATTISEYQELIDGYPQFVKWPNKVYKDEWTGWKSFLGKPENYKTINEASKAAITLGISSSASYAARYENDPKLPSCPRKTYRKDWIGWDHFLGSSYSPKFQIRNFYPTLGEASNAARKLGALNSTHYREIRHLDPKLPSRPDLTYKHEWKDWIYFLSDSGTQRQRATFNTYAEAKAAVRAAAISSIKAYKQKYRLFDFLPGNPEELYSSEWTSWEDFLGVENKKKEHYQTIEEFKIAIRKLGIQNSKDYRANYLRDIKLPANPQHNYKDWVSWYEIFDRKAKCTYDNILEASAAAQRLGIKSARVYTERYKLDPLLPSWPPVLYVEHWAGWPAFLGTERKSPKLVKVATFYESIDLARAACIKLNIKSSTEYHARYRLDPLLPSNPSRVYRKEWISYPDYLGTAKIAKTN